MFGAGQELVDFFASDGREFNPTVVFLDLLMPRKSGLEAMAELPNSLGVPVIAATGNVTDETALRCRYSYVCRMDGIQYVPW